jgi:hypothetical protein
MKINWSKVVKVVVELVKAVVSSKKKAVVLLLLSASPAFAQSTLPRADLSGVRIIGTTTYDWSDGAGGDISYGAEATGFSADGRFLYVSCVFDNNGFAKLELPPTLNGGLMRVVEPCKGPNKAYIAQIHPDPSATTPTLGGIVEYNGEVCVSMFISYDASKQTRASHSCGPTLTSLRGPFAGTVAPGLVKSGMFVVPPEWRQLFGGPVVATAGYTSIISRGSYGLAVTSFDPAAVTANNFPMRNLIGCPDDIVSCRTYGFPASDFIYNGSELEGGVFIVPGTRTLISVEREGAGPTCYGYATSIQADHGKPYLDAVYCYSLSDPPNEKGPKSYPYKLVAKQYDMNDIGTKSPWDIRPYAVTTLPGSHDKINIKSGAWDPVNQRLALFLTSRGGVNEVTFLGGFSAAPPTTNTDCVFTTQITVGPLSPAACDATQVQSYDETVTRTIITPATGTGLACPSPLVTTSTKTQSCVFNPPTFVTTECTVTGKGTVYSDGDQRPIVRCDTNGDLTKSLPVGTKFTVTRPQ